MAKFPVKSRCVSCGSDDLDIPQKKTADTIIPCNACGNKDRWVKIQCMALVMVRKEASIYFQQNMKKLEEAEKIVKDKSTQKKRNDMF